MQSKMECWVIGYTLTKGFVEALLTRVYPNEQAALKAMPHIKGYQREIRTYPPPKPSKVIYFSAAVLRYYGRRNVMDTIVNVYKYDYRNDRPCR